MADSITIHRGRYSCDKPITCPVCRASNPAPGAYAAAHWNDELTRDCDGCGLKLTLRAGMYTVEQPVVMCG